MRLFNYFQKKVSDQTMSEKVPSQSLFVDSTPPVLEADQKLESTISVFLNENHYAAGLSAGYYKHCHDGLSLYLGHLRARFREAIDTLIGRLEEQLLEKEMMSIQIGDLIPSQKQCLELSLQKSRRLIEEAKEQKVLSIDDEGWVSSAVNAFKIGYAKGMIDYFSEKEFFKGL